MADLLLVRLYGFLDGTTTHYSVVLVDNLLLWSRHTSTVELLKLGIDILFFCGKELYSSVKNFIFQ
jgi:hypothetical protein